MKNPCIICLVKPMCRIICRDWVIYVSRKIPIKDVIILFDDFLETIGNYGAMKNYYARDFNITTVAFQRDTEDLTITNINFTHEV